MCQVLVRIPAQVKSGVQSVKNPVSRGTVKVYYYIVTSCSPFRFFTLVKFLGRTYHKVFLNKSLSTNTPTRVTITILLYIVK